MALVIGSIFYNLRNDTNALYSRGALLFFAILLASFASALEVCFESRSERVPLTLGRYWLYTHNDRSSRNITSMHSIIHLLKQSVSPKYLAVWMIPLHVLVSWYLQASMICDLPNKILTSLGFNITLYFMTNLRRTPGHFFTFLLFAFTCTLTMSMYFRCIAALSRTLPEVTYFFAHSIIC